jgi:hypothetical protein
MSRIRDLP